MRILIGAGLLGLALLPAPSARAETFHTCEGFIDSLPAVITSQGVWCLRQDLATAVDSGNAIVVDANNVTIDCNGFKLGNLAAGLASSANGVFASSRANVGVRNCSIRGFQRGVFLSGSGHQVQDNRFDGVGQTAIALVGAHALVRNNVMVDTGGKPTLSTSFGIYIDGIESNVQGNFVRGVAPDATDGYATGIYIYSGVVQGNTVMALVPAGIGYARGVMVGPDSVVRDNSVTQAAATVGHGIYGSGDTVCRGNDIVGFDATPLGLCGSSLDNLTSP